MSCAPYLLLLRGRIVYQLPHIQDQGHTAVPQNRGAGDSLDLPVYFPEGLDNRLMLTDNTIYPEPHALLTGRNHHNSFRVGWRAIDVENLPFE